MTLSTSRVVSSCSKSGFSGPGEPTSASTAVPPGAGLGRVAIGWQAPTRTSATAPRATPARRVTRAAPLFELRHPDVGDRADEEGGDDDPGGPVDLALEAPARPVAATQAIAATTDRPAQPRGLGSLHQHPGHQQDRKHHLDDDEGVLDSIHGLNPGILLAESFVHRVPVDRVEPRGDVVRPLVLVLQVVSVLPHVDAEDRRHAVHVRAVLVRVALDRKLAALVRDQPGPAAAELAHRRLLQLLLERVVGAERAVDGVADVA